MEKTISISLRIICLLIAFGCQREEPKPRYSSLQIGKAIAQVEVVFSPEKQATGLMYRDFLPADSGMLFVYSKPKKLSFWMKNTHIPLSIAFIRSDGTISEILAMTPDDGRPDHRLPRYRSQEEVLYALEMQQNWFKEHGVQQQSKVIFPSDIKRNLP